MARFTATINKPVTNGPYAYVIFRDGVCQKDVNGVTTLANALDGVKTDIAGLLGGETVNRVNMSVNSS